MAFKRARQISLGILAMLLLAPTLASAADPPGIPDGWSDGYVYANGVRLHYYQAVPVPDKPAIVMVHGITDNGLCWTTLTWRLQDEYNIYMLDTRGHGLSDPFTTEDDADTLIKDVVAAVDALGLEQPILMGHSMGGATLMRLGAEYPQLASAIIMLDPPGLGRQGPARDAEERRGSGAKGQGATKQVRGKEGANSRLSYRMAASPEQLVAQNNYSYDDLVATCRRQSPKWDIVDCQYWALSKRQYHGAYSDQAWQAMSGAMRVGDSLSAIPVPTLVLKADASADARAAHLQIAAGMQKGRLVHIDNAGHNLHHDQLDRTVEVLEEFLSAL